MPRIQEQYIAGTGILTRCPSPTLIRLGLGPTNPGVIIMAQETLLFRWEGFSPSLWLLIPAFSLDNAPRLPSGAASMQYQRSSTASPSFAFQTVRNQIDWMGKTRAGPYLR